MLPQVKMTSLSILSGGPPQLDPALQKDQEELQSTFKSWDIQANSLIKDKLKLSDDALNSLGNVKDFESLLKEKETKYDKVYNSMIQYITGLKDENLSQTPVEQVQFLSLKQLLT